VRHPYQKLQPKRLWLYYFIVLVLTGLSGAYLAAGGLILGTDAAPLGIISYELCGTVDGCRAILDSWNDEARVAARNNLIWDFPFLLLYSSTLALGVVGMGRRMHKLRWRMARFAPAMAWAAWIAAVLDSIENIALWTMLASGPGVVSAGLAWICAAIKFLLLGVAIPYFFIGFATFYRRA